MKTRLDKIKVSVERIRLVFKQRCAVLCLPSFASFGSVSSLGVTLLMLFLYLYFSSFGRWPVVLTGQANDLLARPCFFFDRSKYWKYVVWRISLFLIIYLTCLHVYSHCFQAISHQIWLSGCSVLWDSYVLCAWLPRCIRLRKLGKQSKTQVNIKLQNYSTYSIPSTG